MAPGARERITWRPVLALVALLSVLAAGCGREPDGAAGATEADDVAGIAETASLLKGIPQKNLVLGSPDAPVTLVEVIDLQCPFCRAHQLDVQPRLVRTLVRTGRVRIVLAPVSFLGRDSERMEIVMLRLSRSGKAWQFANLVFWNQGQEGSGYATDGWLRRIVAAIPGAADDAASTTPDKAIVQAAGVTKLIAERGMAKVGGSGTPFFMIGRTGKPIYDLDPILGGAPPNTFEIIAHAVKAVEQGQRPEPPQADGASQSVGGA